MSGAPIGWETCPLDIGRCRGCSDLSDLLTSSPQHPWLVKKLPIVAWASFHVKSVTCVPAWPSWKQLIFCLYNEALKEFVFMWWNFSDTQAFERNTESHFYMFHVTAAFFRTIKDEKGFFLPDNNIIIIVQIGYITAAAVQLIKTAGYDVTGASSCAVTCFGNVNLESLPRMHSMKCFPANDQKKDQTSGVSMLVSAPSH